MGRLNRLLLVLLFLALMAFVVLFILENQQAVALVFLGYTSPQLPISVLMLIAILLGLAIGPAMGIWVVLRNHHKRRLKLRESHR
ncbi:lipopolysaccharide assembly protein LapA domain-containing protein [Pseudomonas sp. NFX15]|uniref:lipopolysaccharide assembly protein LapA domain-containing protein n=1 Tax=Pseudomonas sp. NFX15 TaxID=2816958 RepID=UPI003BA12E63